jgi:dipeptide transport system substrate-binding protein
MRKIAEAIAADLARVGIKIQLRALEPGRAARDQDDGRSALYLGERSALSADPDELLVAWWDPPARALLQQARVEPAESKRAELYKQVTKMLQQQMARIPLFHPTRPIAASRKVHGLMPHTTGGEAYTRVSLGR